MAIDPTQLLSDAGCILACIPPGMVPAAQLGQMVQPSVVVTSVVAEPGGTTTAVLLMAANPRRRRAIIQVLGASPIFVGPSNVTTSTGFQIAGTGSQYLSRLEVFSQGELYMSGGTVGQNVSVMEFLSP